MPLSSHFNNTQIVKGEKGKLAERKRKTDGANSLKRTAKKIPHANRIEYVSLGRKRTETTTRTRQTDKSMLQGEMTCRTFSI